MADMKLDQEQRNGHMVGDKEHQDHELVGETALHEDTSSTSDRTSNHESVGGASMEEDPIVTPAAVAAATAAQSQVIKKTLSKQPSNGIHVLKPDGLASANGLPPYPNPDTTPNGDTVNNKHSKEEDITFDPNGSYYMANACCELIHYRTAAILVGIVEILMIIAWGTLIGFFYDHMNPGGLNTDGSKASIGVQSAVAIGFLLVIILMFVGLITERAFLLWPHMIVQIIGISLGIAFTVVAVIAMCAGTSLAEAIFSHLYGVENLPKVEAALGPIWPFCLAVVFDFGAALGIWFYIVIKGCYEYLMDKAFFEKEISKGALKKESLDNAAKKPS